MLLAVSGCERQRTQCTSCVEGWTALSTPASTACTELGSEVHHQTFAGRGSGDMTACPENSSATPLLLIAACCGQVMDKHLDILCKQHLETKFVKVGSQLCMPCGCAAAGVQSAALPASPATGARGRVSQCLKAQCVPPTRGSSRCLKREQLFAVCHCSMHCSQAECKHDHIASPPYHPAHAPPLSALVCPPPPFCTPPLLAQTQTHKHTHVCGRSMQRRRPT